MYSRNVQGLWLRFHEPNHLLLNQQEDQLSDLDTV
jgi:hypothetical protein